MSVLLTIFICFLVVLWPALLLGLYYRYPTQLRFILQSLFLLPFSMILSIIIGFIGICVKYLTNSVLSPEVRIYVLSYISAQFIQFSLFMFEFWPNIQYVVSDENVNDDLFYLNTIITANHSQTLFDPFMIASVADFLGRVQNSFVFVKKEALWIPGIGWVSSLLSGISLQRDWNKDKEYIKKLCHKFKSNTDYRLVTPWCWFSFVEGTRYDKKKFVAAQEFAKKRGFAVYKHLLQPRVKGFSYLAQHLYDVLGTVIDVTVLYQPLPQSMNEHFYNYLVKTRICKYIHLHIRVFRQNEIPHPQGDEDLSELHEWLRDRWTEKDGIMARMKKKEIEYHVLDRSPWKASRYYAIWSTIIIYLVFNAVLDVGLDVFLVILIAALFPIAIVLIEHHQLIMK